MYYYFIASLTSPPYLWSISQTELHLSNPHWHSPSHLDPRAGQSKSQEDQRFPHVLGGRSTCCYTLGWWWEPPKMVGSLPEDMQYGLTSVCVCECVCVGAGGCQGLAGRRGGAAGWSSGEGAEVPAAGSEDQRPAEESCWAEGDPEPGITSTGLSIIPSGIFFFARITVRCC